MANPSLQIGNSKWAIKEDNELGYSTAGTRFIPIPITMTRASAGTRVNAQGLVETVELLGSEEVTNGDFATDTDWVKGTGWTISGGSATSDGSGTSFLYQIISNVQTKRFLIEYEVKDYVSGSVSIILGSAGSDQLTSSSNGVVSGIVLWDGTSDRLNFKSVSLIGSIDNVSVKEYTANNLARVDYDGTASSLLVEPQRINLITYSEAFDNVYWTKSGATVESGFTSPDGTDNAFKLVEDTSTGNHFSSKGNLFTADGNTRSFSIFVKEGERRYIFITNVNTINNDINCVVFDTRDGVFTNTNNPTYILSRNVTALENSWYRIDFTSNTNSGAYDNFFVGISSSGTMSGASYTGDGTSGLYIWGGQAELGSFPTSYIPTLGSTVTRVQETYTKTGISSKINSEEGVLFAEVKSNYDSSQSRRITLSDGSTSNRVSLEFDELTENQIRVFITLNGASETLVYDAPDLSIFNKIAIKWKANDFAIWFNGNEVVTETAEPRVPTGMNQLSFDGGNGANFFYGEVKQLQVFKTALTDTELATLTTQ